VAVDAAVRYIAHRVKADMVILDPADLAAGRQGVFGDGSSLELLLSAFVLKNNFRLDRCFLGIIQLPLPGVEVGQ
jgi:hypothetical protein